MQKSVERLFPFALKARIFIPGRERLSRSKSRIQFILVTEDISQGSYEEILYEYRHYPILKKYSSQDLDEFFGFRNTKVLGFSKSGLSKSIYQELKEFRVNKPESGANSTKRKRDDKPETRSPDSASRQRRQGERIEKNRDSGIGDPPD